MATSAPVSRPPATGHVAMIARQLDYWLTVYKRTWKGTAITSFVMPLFYVLAMGVLLGGFIDKSSAGSASLGGAPSYLAFVAPGLVAAQAMQTATGEVTYPVMGMLKWHRTYYGMTASPLSVADVVNAQLVFVGFRVATSCGVFLVIMSLFGVFHSVLGVIAAWLVVTLVGLVFGTIFFAYSATIKNEAGFAVIFRVLVMPLFLFSGAFFPVSNLSAPLEVVAKLTPLWHGVDLTRMLVLGHVDGSMALVHVAYLVVLVVLGWWLAIWRLQKRMEL
jgi:lipooligosaccharide transport system permease protein